MEVVFVWFLLYLFGCGQYVLVNGEILDCYFLLFGVFQGFCFGFLFFSVYVSKLFEVIKLYLFNVYVFVDDIQFYFFFNLDNFFNEVEVLYFMEQCICVIRVWM